MVRRPIILSEKARHFGYVLKAQAFALGRRSALARTLVAQYRRIRSAALTPPDFIADELTALVTFLRDSDCTFHSCMSLGANPKALGISFRYDVHVRDIAACHAFIEAHRARHIPATFFLLWDYSQLEHSYLGKFRELAAKGKGPIEIGLHDSPVDAYLIQSQFRSDRGSYWAWLNSPEFTRWLGSLARDSGQLADVNGAVLESFISRASRSQEMFGRISTVACHGGDLLQALRNRLDKLDPDVAQVARGFFATGWLTPERVTAAGLATTVDDFGRSGMKWRQVSDGGGAIHRMVRLINELSFTRGMAVQLLLHPFTWDGAKRDGELSRLLQQTKGKLRSETPAIAPTGALPPVSDIAISPEIDNGMFLYIGPADDQCGNGCAAHIAKWEDWFKTRFKATAGNVGGGPSLLSDPDAAMLIIPESMESYDSGGMDRKARNKVRKAEKYGYRFSEIELSSHLKDIHAINTSAQFRQGRPMEESYRRKPSYKPVDRSNFCDRHTVRDFGIFQGELLVAYCRLAMVGELAVLSRVLGHFEHLKFGIMDLLLREIVKTVVEEGRKVRAINYLHMTSSTPGLTVFKRSVGFRPQSTIWVGAGRPEIDGGVVMRGDSLPSRPHTPDRNRLAELVRGKTIKKVVMRGDCCSWRAVLKNPQLFGVRQNHIVRDQKAPTLVYLDHLRGVSYPDELLLAHSNLEEMPPSLHRYYVGQNKCETLQAAGADLLVMDSYADAMFQLYEHRKLGAKLWVNPKYLKNRSAFESTHVRLPRRTFDECIEDVIAYIAHIRKNNPDIPALYLSQPIHFYPPLYSRREFCLLGAELERRVPDLYWGGHLAADQLVPDDLGSCGPGNTLHFMAETYARMVQNAMGIHPDMMSPAFDHPNPEHGRSGAPEIVIG